MILLKKDKKKGNALKNLALISQVGISMITPIFIGLYIGQWIDRLIGTNGLFGIVFMILGVGAAFINLFKITGTFKNKRK